MRQFIILIFLLLTPNFTFAEIIENEIKEEQNFGPWKVICTEDIMMGKTSCKAFTKFYENLATIYIQPHNKIANQVVVIIPPALENTETKVRIDKNEVIKSKNILKDNYGVIPFSSRDQKNMLLQMKNGDVFFVRFTIRDKKTNESTEKTAKISLKDFNNMLMFYDHKIGK